MILFIYVLPGHNSQYFMVFQQLHSHRLWNRISQSFLLNFSTMFCLALSCISFNYIKVIFGLDYNLLRNLFEVYVSQTLCQKLDTFLNTIKMTIFLRYANHGVVILSAQSEGKKYISILKTWYFFSFPEYKCFSQQFVFSTQNQIEEQPSSAILFETWKTFFISLNSLMKTRGRSKHIVWTINQLDIKLKKTDPAVREQQSYLRVSYNYMIALFDNHWIAETNAKTR